VLHHAVLHHALIPFAHLAVYPGIEGGHAIAQTLFGDYNPAGRSASTWYRSTSVLPPQDTEMDESAGKVGAYACSVHRMRVLPCVTCNMRNAHEAIMLTFSSCAGHHLPILSGLEEFNRLSFWSRPLLHNICLLRLVHKQQQHRRMRQARAHSHSHEHWQE
jgi:hypothetical protein